MSFIPVMRPVLPPVATLVPHLERMEAAGIYSNFGPLSRELEEKYSRFLGVPPENVVSVSSATLGLQGAISLAAPNRWLCPDYTFPATGLAVIGAGNTLCLHSVPNPWTPATSLASPVNRDGDDGLLLVLPFGHAVNIQELPSQTSVVIDAAASLGSAEGKLSALPENWCVVFSLHATKVLPAGEGGLAVFGSNDSAAEFRAWSNFGFAGQRISTLHGTNAKMSEIHAAVGLTSLDNWRAEQEEWLEAGGLARGVSQDLGLRSLLQDAEYAQPYWIVEIEDDQLLQHLERHLRDHGIGSRRWWPKLLSEMPAFETALRGSNFSADIRAPRHLGLPMFRGLTQEHVDRIHSVLCQAGLP